MPKAEDPYYNRKPVPDEFVQDVGPTGLTPLEEYANRERKYSDASGVDVRKFGFGSKSGWKPQADPYYGRKSVSKAEIDGVGETGLSVDEEFLNRERKLSINGVDVRRFSNSATGGFKPQSDPYYGRKPVSSKLTKGIGETGQTPAESFEVRERKQSIVNFSSDPFQLVSGQGHRASISAGHVAGAAAAATRRRSSAAAPDWHHSGFDGAKKLEPIESRPELPPVEGIGKMDEASSSAAATGTNGGATTISHPHVYDDPDSVAPHETR